MIMNKDFDVIIIGSGIGGLISAGLLSSNGLRPLLIEAHHSPGGYLSSFERVGFTFDSAVDCISGIGPNGLITNVLSSLDVSSQLEFLQVSPIRSSIFPDLVIDVDADLSVYIERLSLIFPSESDGIKSFFKAAAGAYDNVLANIDIFADDYLNRSSDLLPDIIKYRNISYDTFLKEHISGQKLKAVLSDRTPFLGLPPSKISALPMIMMMMSYFRLGAFRPVGGFQKLSDLLVEGINKKGGKVIFNTQVNQIVHDAQTCSGVKCEGGAEYTAKHIISNADFTYTFKHLLGGDHSAIAEDMVADPGVSTSFFMVYAGLKGEFDGHSSIGYFPSYDLEGLFGSQANFKKDGTLGVTVASVEDRSRAPEGDHTVVLHEMVESNAENYNKKDLAETVIEKAEHVIPDLKDRIVLLDSASPVTLERYTRNLNGAAFGWKQVPSYNMARRHGLKNLSIAGHWGEMGGGVLAAAYSGAKAAADILNKEGVRIGK